MDSAGNLCIIILSAYVAAFIIHHHRDESTFDYVGMVLELLATFEEVHLFCFLVKFRPAYMFTIERYYVCLIDLCEQYDIGNSVWFKSNWIGISLEVA